MNQQTLTSRLHVARQELIIDAAEIVFLRQGIAATAMADVAKEAGCSKRTLYHHFRSKQELISEVMLRGFHVLIERLTETHTKYSTTDAVTQLRAATTTLIVFSTDFPEYFRTIVEFEPAESDYGLGDDSVVSRAFALGEELHGVLVTIVTAGIEQGAFRQDLDPTKTALSLWLTAQSVVWMAQRKSPYLTETHRTEPAALFDAILDLLLSGLVAQGERND